MINWNQTGRGFMKGVFIDLYNQLCSIQESSLATEEAIWLGRDDPPIVEGSILSRMHLTREMAAELARILQHFSDTGELNRSTEPQI
jgi:hypothetical protein